MKSTEKKTNLSVAVFLILAALLLLVMDANAALPIKAECETAAEFAAVKDDVPINVMLAITRVETGDAGRRDRTSWPWAVNVKGQGHWFSDRADALNFARRLRAQGETLFDIGCFQINFHWHGNNFSSVSAMIDPRQDVRYAARFLKHHYRRTGDWSLAAGAYHSKTPAHANAYRIKFDASREALAVPTVAEPPKSASGRSPEPLFQTSMLMSNARPLISHRRVVTGNTGLGTTTWRFD